MAETAPRLRVLLIDPDVVARAEFRAISHPDIETHAHPVRWPVSTAEAISGYDVIIVGVDTAIGLQVLADICARPGASPVIGMAGSGFDGKSLEHVLLLAEVRGAGATMMKPVDAGEITFVISAVVALRRAIAASKRRSA